MVMAISSYQVSKNLGVTGVRLGPRGDVALAVATRSQRIDGIDLITRCD